MVFPMARGMDQSQSHVYLWCRFLPIPAWSYIAVHRSSIDSAAEPRAREHRSYNFLAALDVVWTHAVRARVAWVLLGRSGKSFLRLLRRDQPPPASDVLLHSFRPGQCAGNGRGWCHGRAIGVLVYPLGVQINRRRFPNYSPGSDGAAFSDRRIYEL